MLWHLAPSLDQLRTEINTVWPDRDKKSDGTVGDTAHSARVSDHNPNSRRSVNALDIDRDGIDPMRLVRLAIADKRTNYVIYNRRIYSRVRGFTPKTYTGSNPHTAHVHVSILQTAAAENDTRSWGLASAKPTPKPKPSGKAPRFPLPKGHYFGPKSGPDRSHSGYYNHRADLKRFQAQMLARGWSGLGAADGFYGPSTAKVVKAFQREKGLPVDGLIGATTWAAAWTEPVT